MLLEKKKVCSIKKIIDFSVINEEENNNYTNIECNHSKEKYEFKIEEDIFNIAINKEKILFLKENNNSILKMELIENKKTDGTYFIKQLESSIDVKVESTNQKILDDIIEVTYKLWLQDEYTGIFSFKLSIKE